MIDGRSGGIDGRSGGVSGGIGDVGEHPATRWWAANAADLSDPVVAGGTARAALLAGLFSLPGPGGGATAARWQGLAALAAADVTLAKLGEAHADAVAILAELGGADPADDLWAVWAANTPTLTARRAGAGWLLSGTKPWASGATCCTRALVTALAPDGERLLALDVADSGIHADPTSWPSIAMSGTASLTLTLTDVPAAAVGEPGEYVGRPGFWQGGAGIAACWYGGALGIAELLRARVAASPDQPHRAAHLGAVHAALAAADAVLTAAAGWFDTAAAASGARRDDGFTVAMTARAVVEQSAAEVIERVGRALGPGPLAGDRAHSRRVADLELFLRQSHAEVDLADLGRRVAGG